MFVCENQLLSFSNHYRENIVKIILWKSSTILTKKKKKKKQILWKWQHFLLFHFFLFSFLLPFIFHKITIISFKIFFFYFFIFISFLQWWFEIYDSKIENIYLLLFLLLLLLSFLIINDIWHDHKCTTHQRMTHFVDIMTSVYGERGTIICQFLFIFLATGNWSKFEGSFLFNWFLRLLSAKQQIKIKEK